MDTTTLLRWVAAAVLTAVAVYASSQAYRAVDARRKMEVVALKEAAAFICCVLSIYLVDLAPHIEAWLAALTAWATPSRHQMATSAICALAALAYLTLTTFLVPRAVLAFANKRVRCNRYGALQAR